MTNTSLHPSPTVLTESLLPTLTNYLHCTPVNPYTTIAYTTLHNYSINWQDEKKEERKQNRNSGVRLASYVHFFKSMCLFILYTIRYINPDVSQKNICNPVNGIIKCVTAVCYTFTLISADINYTQMSISADLVSIFSLEDLQRENTASAGKLC